MLAGDVGGTKTALALVQNGMIVERRVYPSAAFTSLETMVSNGRARERHLQLLGIAGPVIGDSCRTTNLRWIVDARSLEHALKLSRVMLVNDFHALAIGVTVLPGPNFAVS